MGFFSKTLQAAMPKMIGNPITTAVAMVSVALSVVKGKKATKATKNKKKATVKKSKIISKKQKKQMEVMERVCQSAYGIYIRGVTTVAARYIGHPAVAIPASEMVKTMMEEAAPTVNYLVQLEAGSKKESNIKEEKNRIDKHTSGRFEYLKGCTNGWYTGFTKAIKGEQVIDEKYTLENLFSGNLTVEDMPDLPEYMTMVGAVIGAKYKGLWNSAKGTYDGVVTLVTDPEKVLEVASDAILDFMEDPWENTKELAGNIRDSVVDAVWRSTPQEISEDAGEILGDVLTAVSTGGGGKAAASGAKIAGNKLLALGKTGVREFVEGLEDLGKIGAKNAVYVGATTGIENAAKNSFINRLMMMASEAGDEAKKLTGVVEGATSKADDIATIAGKTGSVTNTVTSTTGELIENAVIGTPIVEGIKKTDNIIKDELLDKAKEQTIDIVKDEIIDTVQNVAEENSKIIENKGHTEQYDNQNVIQEVIRENSGKNEDGVHTSPAVNESQVNSVTSTTTNNAINNTVTNGARTVQYGQHFERVDRKKVLKANIKYIDSNGYTYITDNQRRIIHVEGTLKLQSGKRNTGAQVRAGGKDRIQNLDQGGHLIGTQFNGSGNLDNLVPQHKDVNGSGGEWYNMEMEWAKALKEGKKVEVNIEVIYSGSSARPDSFSVLYKINGQEQTKIIQNPGLTPSPSQ